MALATTGIDEMRRFLPCRVQKASVLPDGAFALDVYVPSTQEKRFVVVMGADLQWLASRPSRELDGPPPASQGVLRKELVPSIVTDVVDGEFHVEIGFDRKEDRLSFLIERTDDPRAVLVLHTPEGQRVLLTLGGASRPVDGRDVRRGRLYQPPQKPRKPRASSSATTDGAQPAPRVLPALAQARAGLRAEAKRLKRLVEGLLRDLDRHGDPALHEESGELLKTVLSGLKRGAANVVVTNWSGEQQTLDLEPTLTPSQNLALFFKRAKRAREARARVAPRLTEAQKRLSHVEELRRTLAQNDVDTDAIERVQMLLAKPETGGSARRKAAKAGPRKAWRSFRVSRDVVVRVGRGARDNDALVKDARGHDLWLHARDQHGAHVVVPSGNDDVDSEVLLDALHLAAHFSAARGELHVDVQTTRVKNLKKPGAGAASGLVHVSNETVVHVRVDHARLARLLAAEVPSS